MRREREPRRRSKADWKRERKERRDERREVPRKKAEGDEGAAREKGDLEPPEEIIMVDDSGEAPGGTDSPPGLWATVPPSQADTAKMGSSEEASPSAAAAKKAKVGRDGEGAGGTEGRSREVSPAVQETSWESRDSERRQGIFSDEEEEGDVMKDYLEDPGVRKDALVGKPYQTVRRLINAFQTRFSFARDVVCEEWRYRCASCENAVSKMNLLCDMSSRLHVLLWQRSRDYRAKLSKAQGIIEELEREKRELEEAKERLE